MLTHARTFGASRVNILAKITWPARAKRIWFRNVENHIIHSKSATSCGKGSCIINAWQPLSLDMLHQWIKLQNTMGYIKGLYTSDLPSSCQSNAILVSHFPWRPFGLHSLNEEENTQDVHQVHNIAFRLRSPAAALFLGSVWTDVIIL